MSLARLLHRLGKPAEGRAVLATVYAAFAGRWHFGGNAPAVYETQPAIFGPSLIRMMP
jgi:hypothetical protein